MSDTALHTKYRPTSLDKLIGHEEAVTRMKGMISSGKIPSAILITGPTSVGKTTIARAFVSDLNGSPDFIKSPDYREINVADQRGIDDIRDLVRLSKLRPMVGKKKVFLLDECQALVSSPAAAACIESDTLILTNKGKIPAQELHARISQGEQFKVLSFNHKTGKKEWKEILASRETLSSKDTVEFSNGAKVTQDHLVWDKNSREYKEAQDFNSDTLNLETTEG